MHLSMHASVQLLYTLEEVGGVVEFARLGLANGCFVTAAMSLMSIELFGNKVSQCAYNSCLIKFFFITEK